MTVGNSETMSDNETINEQDAYIAELEASRDDLTDQFEDALNTIAELTARLTTEGESLAALIEARQQVNDLTEQLRSQGQSFTAILIQMTDSITDALTDCTEAIALQAGTIHKQAERIHDYEALVDRVNASRATPTPDIYQFRDNRRKQ